MGVCSQAWFMNHSSFLSVGVEHASSETLDGGGITLSYTAIRLGLVVVVVVFQGARLVSASGGVSIGVARESRSKRPG